MPITPNTGSLFHAETHASIAAAMHLQPQFDGLGPGYHDSVLLGAACKRNHRFNDAVAYGSGTRGGHDVTILM
jgi:hypothetical protein